VSIGIAFRCAKRKQDRRGNVKKPAKKIAVVGAGYWGKNLVRNFASLGSLSVLCDLDEKNLNESKKTYPGLRTTTSLPDILSDDSIDAVVISTPAEMHYQMVRDCLLADKHVFVEKPLALNVEQGEELVKLSDERERILMVGHLLQYHPAVIKLKELVEGGELGKIQYIYSNRLNLGKIRREENILWSFAPHDISVILSLTGEMPESACSSGGNYLHEKIADVTLSHLSFPSGIKAHIFVSWLHPYKEQRLVIVGDRKMASFNDLNLEDKLIVYPHIIEWKDHLPTPNMKEGQVVPVDQVEPLREECRHFLECITHNRQPRTGGPEGLKVLTVLQACQESLEHKGKIVPVSPPSDRKKREEQRYFVDKTSTVDEGCIIGRGTRIWHFSHIIKGSVIGNDCSIGQNVMIGPDVTIGNTVKIQNNVSVYPGVTLEDGVFCGPSMVFTNVFNPRSYIPRKDEIRPTTVKEGATLGANSTIICGHTIGRFAFVAAGSVVLHDIPDFALVAGNPAVIKGWICRCGVRLHFEDGKATCDACGLKYRREKDRITTIS
jgi:UDP-2-acetamido-3-amino-2,3-dideoxy-glucuronate N-acetyltransferase